MFNLFVIPQNWFRLAKKKLRHEIDQAETQLSYNRHEQTYFDTNEDGIKYLRHGIEIIISKVYL